MVHVNPLGHFDQQYEVCVNRWFQKEICTNFLKIVKMVHVNPLGHFDQQYEVAGIGGNWWFQKQYAPTSQKLLKWFM